MFLMVYTAPERQRPMVCYFASGVVDNRRASPSDNVWMVPGTWSDAA